MQQVLPEGLQHGEGQGVSLPRVVQDNVSAKAVKRGEGHYNKQQTPSEPHGRARSGDPPSSTHTHRLTGRPPPAAGPSASPAGGAAARFPPPRPC